MPWSEVRQAREHELKHLRDFGVFEKVDEREAIAKYQIPPVDTNGTGTQSVREGSPSKSGRDSWQENSKVEIDHTCMRAPPLEALNSNTLCCSESGTDTLHRAHRRVTYVFSSENSETCAGPSASGGQTECRRSTQSGA